MQNVEIMKPIDTSKILSEPMTAELSVFTADTQSRETVWFDVRD